MNTHVGVSGILYENGQVLLGKRSPDDEAFPGLWQIEILAGEPQALDGLSEFRWFTWQDIREASAENLLTPLTDAALKAFYNSF